MNYTEQILHHAAHPASDVRPASIGENYPCGAMPVYLRPAWGSGDLVLRYRAYNPCTGYLGTRFYAVRDLAVQECVNHHHTN